MINLVRSVAEKSQFSVISVELETMHFLMY